MLTCCDSCSRAAPNAAASGDKARKRRAFPRRARRSASARDAPVGDGDTDALHASGARGGVSLAFDSGDLIERTPAAERPDLFDGTRSDNKGPEPEPEHVALGRGGGELYAFVGLERANPVAAFRIGGPEDVSFAGFVAAPEDAGPEVFVFAPALFVRNEVSGDARAFALNWTA